jgi:3-oxoadipate enol-lactonase
VVSETSAIVIGAWPDFEERLVPGAAGWLNIRLGGAPLAPAVLFNHSILTSSAIWAAQARLLVAEGFRVICLDSRGHGKSPAPTGPYAMKDLVDDNIAVLDALGIGKVHYVGVSQGGMTGLGLALGHAERLLSACICAARADAPAPFAASWDERIDLVRSKGVSALALPTAERWFGTAFLAANPIIAAQVIACIEQTSAEGFIGCARAIQGLAYLPDLHRIRTPATLLVGARDEPMVVAMRELQPHLPGARLEIIADAGHLPQIDQPNAFNALLLEHLQRHRQP